MLANNGQKDGEDVVKVARQINDLEAHVNTAIITEKSVRKAQDKYLAEEVDKFNKQMTAIQDKIKISMDEEGNVLSSDKNKQGVQIDNLTQELATLKDQSKTLQATLNDIVERGGIKSDGDAAITQTVKSEHIKELEDQVKALNDKSELISSQIKDLEEFKTTTQEESAKSKDKVYTTVEMVDGKIQNVLEKLKNDNQMIWKDSITLAEK